MIKIDIISGFLGAGKTTVIKKLLQEAYMDEQVVLIENEFGQVNIDSVFLEKENINIQELNAGCICCTIVGDFEKSLIEVIDTYQPDRIIIEPSGVGKLSDVIKAIQNMQGYDIKINTYSTIVDVKKYQMYLKNFGEFFKDQIENAKCIIFSRVDLVDEAQIKQCIQDLKKMNEKATWITTPIQELSGQQILTAMEVGNECMMSIKQEAHHHTHHHADDIFHTWNQETTTIYTEDEIINILKTLSHDERFNGIIRAKGYVKGEGSWLFFDMTPQEFEIRKEHPKTIGQIVVIGTHVDKQALQALWG